MNNSNLSYSLEALRVKSLFYGKRAMVYVEGDEDLNFWEPYFDKNIFHIENVGGSSNLIPYIDKLNNGEDSFIVACDADYSSFKQDNTIKSDLIVTTYGHSIENMMYCPSNLNAAVRKLSKSLKESTVTIEAWYEKFVFTAHPLLLREICNQIYKPQETKVQVFGDNCARFCKQKPCYELDEGLIDKFCNENQENFPNEVLSRIDTAIKEDGRAERQLIKGHFLTYAVRNLVCFLAESTNSTKTKCNISNGYLYALTVHCEDCGNNTCLEKMHILKCVTKAIEKVKLVE